MESILWEAFEQIINLFESFIFIDFISKFFGYKYKGMKRHIGYALGIASQYIYVAVVNQVTIFEGIETVISVAIFVAYSILFLKSKWLLSIFIGIGVHVAVMMINGATITCVSFITGLSIANIVGESSVVRAVMVIITKVVFFILTRIALGFKEREYELNKKEWFAVISVSAISISIINFILEILITNPQLDTNLLYVLLAIFGVVVVNIIMYYLFLKINHDNKLIVENTKKEQKYKFEIKNVELIKNQFMETNKIRHDMKNQLTCIGALLDAGKLDEANKYLEGICNKINNIEAYVMTSNHALNGIVNSKLSLCRDCGIKTAFEVVGDISKVNEADFCILLGNLMDNAIEASSRCKDGEKRINLKIADKNEYVYISVKNTVKISVLKANPKLLTTKNNKKLHGFGIESIKEIVDKYDGIIDFVEENDMFICDILLKKL